MISSILFSRVVVAHVCQNENHISPKNPVYSVAKLRLPNFSSVCQQRRRSTFWEISETGTVFSPRVRLQDWYTVISLSGKEKQ